MLKKFRAAIAFYTCLPVVSNTESLDFQGIALYAPLIGGMLGGGLAGMAIVTTSLNPQGYLWTALVVVLMNIWLTGGLHLDGAMDTADGLAVGDPSQRLSVMADSRTGAFGAIALVSIFSSKLIGICDLLIHLQGKPWSIIWLLANAYTWSRWGQLRAIKAFTYLKAEGKGKFHQEGIAHWQVWLMAVIVISLNTVIGVYQRHLQTGIFLSLTPLFVTIFIGKWFNHRLGGQTGDTYGAIVEWTEAITLLIFPLLL